MDRAIVQGWNLPGTPEDAPEGTMRLGPKVALGTLDINGNTEVGIWHWCDHSIDGQSEPEWRANRLKRHTIITVSPLTLSPSVWFDDCCGLHGWVRDGVWIDV
jgi:hypothetical protein